MGSLRRSILRPIAARGLRTWRIAALVAALGIVSCGATASPSASRTPTANPTAIPVAPAAFCKASGELGSALQTLSGTVTAPQQTTADAQLTTAAADFHAAAGQASDASDAALFEQLSTQVSKYVADVSDIQAQGLDLDGITAALRRAPTCVGSVGTPVPLPTPTPVPTPEPPSLVYEVDGTGTATVTYFVGPGSSQEQHTVQLPWSLVVAQIPDHPILNAQHQSGGQGTISCTITRFGSVIAHAASSGSYAVVQCAPNS
jgi:Mycobacterium membrane protein